MDIQTEPKVERGEINTEGDQIRKISGIAVHDPIFHDLVITTTIIEAMKQLMTPNLKLFRADALMKPPFVGSAKGMHQDSPYWPIKYNITKIPTLIIIIPKDAGIPCFNKSFMISTFGKKHLGYK